MINTLRALLMALLLVVAGATTAAATHGQPDRATPISGDISGIDTPPDFTAPGCPEGASWRFESTGTGTLGHLGTVAFELADCTTLDPADFSLSIAGTLWLTAANGDVLVISLTGTGTFNPLLPPSPTVPWDITAWQVDQGTGRFADAAGSGHGHALTHIAQTAAETDSTEISITGTISYDASDRSHK
jgi:hypothetical protein